jgi:hypothetical protein
MSEKITVSRWIDIDSQEAKSLEDYSAYRKIIFTGLDCKIIKIDKSGCLFMMDGNPVHTECNKQLVGIKFSKKAPN